MKAQDLTSRPLGRAALALAAGVVTTLTATSARADEGPIENGFVLETNLLARAYELTFTTGQTINTGTNGPTLAAQTPLVAGSFIAGYKLGRLIFGLGLDFANTSGSASSNTAGQSTSESLSVSQLLIGPDFQAELVRSADQRVALVADLSLHLGHEFVSTQISPAPTGASTPTDSNILINYRIGVGVRFWAHHHFAFQMLTGFGGQADVLLPVNNDPNEAISQHGIYAAFGGIGAF